MGPAPGLPAMTPTDPKLLRHYYLDLAAAYVRGALPDPPDLPPGDLIRHGIAVGLTMNRFKRTAELPRVRRVLGLLRGLVPESLLDVGSGRGVFLWPLVCASPE